MAHHGKNRARRLVHKYRMVMKAGGKCSICGYCKNLSSLVFHHTDAKNVQLTGRAMTANNKAAIEAEMTKCVLLCHNCHFELHSPELSMKKLSRMMAALDSKIMTMNEACAYYVSAKE